MLIIDNVFFMLWDNKIVQKIWSVFSVILLESTVCMMIYRWLVLHNKQGIYHREDAFFYSIACFAFLLILDMIGGFVLRVQKKNEELRKKEEENMILEDYSSRLEKLYKEIRSFKHDYINLLSSLYLYIEEENYSDMRNYFLEHIFPSGQNLTKEDEVIGKLSNIKLPDIKGLIYLKLINAFHEHLQVKVELKEEIVHIAMDNDDFVRVLGIFLDNAIESTKDTEEKYLYIGFLVLKDVVYIRIENSIEDKEVNFSQLCQYGYSTKGNHRGVGLYNVEQILNKYSNVLHNTKITEKRFVQELKIYGGEL